MERCCKYNNCKICGYKSECKIYKENAKLKEINTHTLSQLNLDNGELIIGNEKLRKENAELKLKLKALDGQIPWKDIKDIEAHYKTTGKEIIDKLLSRLNRLTYTGLNCEECKEAEEYLKTV